MHNITIAVIPKSFTSYTISLAQKKGFFQQEGLNVTLRTYPHGKATLQALSNKEADLAVSSETPFMQAVMNGADIAAIAVTVKAKKHLAVVARRDKGIESAKDLRGKRIGVTKGSNGGYFLDTFLLLHQMRSSDVQTVHLLPGEMVDALRNGEVDAIASWNPVKHLAMKQLANNGRIFDAEGLYTPFFLLSAGKENISAHPEVMTKVVRALMQASSFIRDNIEEAHALVAPLMQTDKNLLHELSATYEFEVTLDQALLLTLENQSRWAIQNKLSERTDMPNFLDFIYIDAIRETDPQALKIIH